MVPMGTRRLAIDLVGQVCSVGVLASYHESVSDSQRSPALTLHLAVAVGSCLACHSSYAVSHCWFSLAPSIGAFTFSTKSRELGPAGSTAGPQWTKWGPAKVPRYLACRSLAISSGSRQCSFPFLSLSSPSLYGGSISPFCILGPVSLQPQYTPPRSLFQSQCLYGNHPNPGLSMLRVPFLVDNPFTRRLLLGGLLSTPHPVPHGFPAGMSFFSSDSLYTPGKTLLSPCLVLLSRTFLPLKACHCCITEVFECFSEYGFMGVRDSYISPKLETKRKTQISCILAFDSDSPVIVRRGFRPFRLPGCGVTPFVLFSLSLLCVSLSLFSRLSHKTGVCSKLQSLCRCDPNARR